MELVHRVELWMSEHREEITAFLQDLVRSSSLPGHEAAAQQLIAQRLERLDLEVDVWEPDGEVLQHHPQFCAPRTDFKGSPNVVGVWRGQGSCSTGKSLLLNGHVDVVPVGDVNQWENDPWSGAIVGNRLYGRGSTDMKGGLVASLMAIACLRDLDVQLCGDVIYESVIEEESGGLGTLATLERGYRADAAIIPEPTDLKIFPKQQGSIWFRVHVTGLSAHGGTRYEGVSAIDKAVSVVEALHHLEEVRNVKITDPLYDETPIPVPINVGMISGGEWPSSVPDSVVLEGRMGVAPEENMAAAKAELEERLRQLAREDDWLSGHPVRVEWFGAQWHPGAVDVQSPIMTSTKRAYEQVTGDGASIKASPWGTDGGLLQSLGGIPSVVFGPGKTQMAHFPNEYVEIDKVIQCSSVIAVLLADWCGVESKSGSEEISE